MNRIETASFASVVAPATDPQARLLSCLNHVSALQRDGDLRTAVAELEAGLAEARREQYEIEFQTRVQAAMTLVNLYLDSDETQKAKELLAEESAFVESVFQIMQMTGTLEQKRAAGGGRAQVLDRARQVALLGEEAPRIRVKEWINGEPTTLEDLRGRVVLLEFWATWCKPCQEMFGKLKQLDETYRERGLEIVALTRHYFAYRDTGDSEAQELQLMRGVVGEHDVKFLVGVAEDESAQERYGATGLPTLFLIDRTGKVRYTHFGGEDARFKFILEQALNEQS